MAISVVPRFSLREKKLSAESVVTAADLTSGARVPDRVNQCEIYHGPQILRVIGIPNSSVRFDGHNGPQVLKLHASKFKFDPLLFLVLGVPVFSGNLAQHITHVA